MAASVEPTQLHPDHVSHRYVVFLGIAAMMTLLSSVFVSLRFVSRRLTSSLAWDDWTVLAALIVAYGFLLTTALVATIGGAGYHINQYSLSQLEKYLKVNRRATSLSYKTITDLSYSPKIALANNILYNASISLSKASVLLLYRRIFTVDRTILVSTKIVGGVLVGYFIAAAGGLIFANSPIEAQWKVWLPSTSIDNKRFWLAMAIVNILLDVVILCLPQARVWKLQLSTHRKALVSLVFMLGAFVCVTSIIRIVSLLTIDIADLTYTLTTPGIWTLVEMDTSIICSCLPTLPSLFVYWRDGATPKGSKAGSRATKAYLLRSARKDKGTGYANLRDTSTPQNLSSGQGFHNSIESTADSESHDMTPLGAVRVRREVEVESGPR